MHPRRLAVTLSAPLALWAVLGATADAPPSSKESCESVLRSEVCTWVVMEGGAVLELGATVPMTLIEGVPLDAEMTWPPRPLASIALPEEARAALGIDHMGIHWEAHGHPPAAFLVQHFDFHFYSITEEEVGAIDCADGSKPPTLPAGYVLPDIDVPGLGMLVGLCVPRMGMHAMPEADAASTEGFDASMMVGYYGGRPVFFEPMVSRTLLLQRADFALPMPAVGGAPEGVLYPTAFRAEYQAGSDRYRLVFSGFGPDEIPTPTR